MESCLSVKSLLKRLISFDSVEGNEKEIALFLCDYFQAMGMDSVKLQEVFSNRYNVVAKKSFGKASKTIILNSHMDVVPPGDGWETPPYQAVEKGSRLYGRGATDAKGALACFIVAVERIMANPNKIDGTIILAPVCDEESFSYGARKLVELPEIRKADYCIVGEPTWSRVALSHNGSLRPVILIKGKSAHASNPDLGISAIRVAAYISEQIDKMNHSIKSIVHPSAGKPSVALTMIKGGLRPNIIPDLCEIVIDRRMVPGEEEAAIKVAFEKMCCQTQEAFPGSAVWIDRYLVTTGPAAETLPNEKIAQIAFKAAEKASGEQQFPFGLTCNTDMNHFTRAGIPSIIIGPGSIEVAHMSNEYVELPELEKCVNVDEAVVRSLLQEEKEERRYE